MQDRLPSLTGLRLVAAVTVVVSHMLEWMVKPIHPIALLNALSTLSGFGMTLFFVLSGFVIHRNYGHSVSTLAGLRKFFIARFARLYPLYLLFLCADLLLKFGFNQFHWERLAALPFYLTLTQSWFYLPIDGNALIYQFGLAPQVSWSISTEWFFYLAFPLLALGIARLRRPQALLIAIGALCAFALLAVTAINLGAPYIATFGLHRYGAIGASGQDGFFRWLAYFSPYVRILEFALGCLVSALVRRLAPPMEDEQPFGLILLAGAIGATLGLQWIMFGHAETPWLIVALHMNFGFAPLAATIVFGCARYRNWIVRALSTERIVMGGEASYSIYLSHLIIINAFRYEAPTITGTRVAVAVLVQLATTTVAIVGSSLVLWSLVEMPARRAIRRLA